MGNLAVNLTSLAVSISVSRSKAFYGNSGCGSPTLENRTLGKQNFFVSFAKYQKNYYEKLSNLGEKVQNLFVGKCLQ